MKCVRISLLSAEIAFDVIDLMGKFRRPNDAHPAMAEKETNYQAN